MIQWSKLFEDEIKDLQFEAFIQIKEAFSWNTKKRYETLLKQLDKIDDGIICADLTKVQLKDLYTIKNNILYQIDTIEKSVTANPRVTKTNELGYKEQLDFKLNELN